MERRSDLLIQELCDLLGTGEVYFQPSADAGKQNGESYIFTGIEYPCFIIKRVNAFQPKANNKTYLFRQGYEITYINRDEPDPEMVDKVMNHFSLIHYERHYVSDNLHHDLFMLYY